MALTRSQVSSQSELSNVDDSQIIQLSADTIANKYK